MPLKYASDALSGFSIVIEIVKKLSNHNEVRKRDILELYLALKEAIGETKAFIKNNRGSYVANLGLQMLWLRAFKCAHKKTFKNDKEFPRWLNSKAKFWEDPQQWLKEDGCMEMVKELRLFEAKVDELEGYLDL